MKADPPSTTATHVGTQFETKGERGKQDLAKADTPSSTPTHVGKQWKQWETRLQEDGRTIQQKETIRVDEKAHPGGVI